MGIWITKPEPGEGRGFNTSRSPWPYKPQQTRGCSVCGFGLELVLSAPIRAFSLWQSILMEGRMSGRTPWQKGGWAATESPARLSLWGHPKPSPAQSLGLWLRCAQASIPPSRNPPILAGSSFPACFANWELQQGSAVPALRSPGKAFCTFLWKRALKVSKIYYHHHLSFQAVKSCQWNPPKRLNALAKH